MNKRHPYNDIIERKLEQLPVADANLLWNDMYSILDKKMPQKKERRRFIVWWFLSGKGLLLLTVGVLTITGTSLFFLSTKESSVVTIEKLPGSPQSGKFIEDESAKVSLESKENITTASATDQIPKDNSSATIKGDKASKTTASLNAVENAVNNNSITKQTIKRSEKYTTEKQFNQPIQVIPEAVTNFDIAPVNLKSIHQDFHITTNHNKEKNSLSQRPEPVAYKMRANTWNNNESGFYSGIMAGVDMSSIHFKSAKPGATMGLIIGYAFNKKWSIESGLLWDTKRVYDDGSYFNPPGYSPTNGVTIVAVNGKSRLFEWPVNMKYTIIPGKHSLFTTAGISSYFMRSENYDYEYVQNNQPGGHNYLSYTNETKDWFSVANFSIGYSHKLGNNGNIRVEPYLKLPIKNIGTGNMPVMSTGLNIGFTKPLR
jgi:hypothetical protein